MKVKQDALVKTQASIQPGCNVARVIHSLTVQLFAGARFEVNSSGMEGDRIASALARIEAASARIEAAAARRATSDPVLQARYDRLRREAESALTQVDALIETLSS